MTSSSRRFAGNLTQPTSPGRTAPSPLARKRHALGVDRSPRLGRLRFGAHSDEGPGRRRRRVPTPILRIDRPGFVVVEEGDDAPFLVDPGGSAHALSEAAQTDEVVRLERRGVDGVGMGRVAPEGLELHPADRTRTGGRGGHLRVHRTDVPSRVLPTLPAAARRPGHREGAHGGARREQQQEDPHREHGASERTNPLRLAGRTRRASPRASRSPGSLGEEERPHHLVVLVVEDVAVPDVARPARRGIEAKGFVPARVWPAATSCGAQRSAIRVTAQGNILNVSFHPASRGSGGTGGPTKYWPLPVSTACLPPRAPAAFGVV